MILYSTKQERLDWTRDINSNLGTFAPEFLADRSPGSKCPDRTATSSPGPLSGGTKALATVEGSSSQDRPDSETASLRPADAPAPHRV
jgi:hypothetical protein